MAIDHELDYATPGVGFPRARATRWAIASLVVALTPCIGMAVALYLAQDSGSIGPALWGLLLISLFSYAIFVTGPLGLIFASFALASISAAPQRLRGKWIAIAGASISLVSLVANIVAHSLRSRS